ncbi:hypothetical protein VDGL01_06777 [Verticillium dahliae]
MSYGLVRDVVAGNRVFAGRLHDRQMPSDMQVGQPARQLASRPNDGKMYRSETKKETVPHPENHPRTQAGGWPNNQSPPPHSTGSPSTAGARPSQAAPAGWLAILGPSSYQTQRATLAEETLPSIARQPVWSVIVVVVAVAVLADRPPRKGARDDYVPIPTLRCTSLSLDVPSPLVKAPRMRKCYTPLDNPRDVSPAVGWPRQLSF